MRYNVSTVEIRQQQVPHAATAASSQRLDPSDIAGSRPTSAVQCPSATRQIQNHPENVLSSFEACLRFKVGFELDVRRTKDGRLVILHDATLERTTTGAGKVAEVTLDELKKLDAGTKYHARFTGTKVPELGELFRLASKMKRFVSLICIDLKIDDGFVEGDVVKLAKEFDILDKLLFIGSAIENVEVRQRLRAADPSSHVCCLANKPNNLTAALEDKHSDCLCPLHPVADQMKAIRGQQRVILVGHSSRQGNDHWKKAAAVGVDAILTIIRSSADLLAPRNESLGARCRCGR